MRVKKAFGKFNIDEPLPLRGFEIFFGIPSREGPNAWISSYPSVQALLTHLQRYTHSTGSRESYLNQLKRFCISTGQTPDQLTTLDKTAVEQLIQSYLDEMNRRGKSPSYLNTTLKRLKTFYTVNGYKNLNLHRFHQPARSRKKSEYIPLKREAYGMADASGSTRNRALILCLWSSGLRVSTLSALNYGDLSNDLENDEPIIRVPVYPEMKLHVPDAAKGSVPYYSFISSEAGAALRVYLRERKEQYGPINVDDPLFHSQWHLYRHGDRSNRRLGRRGIGLIVKRAAKLAGLKEWASVSPHCLRKAFESVLRSNTVDGGRMDAGTQQFLFGHVLPGSQDVYYDRSNVDYHRSEYGKLDFSLGPVSVRSEDKLINRSELKAHFKLGWSFVSKIDESTIIVRKTM